MTFRVSHWHLNLIHKTPGEAQPGYHGRLHPVHILGLLAHGFQVLPNMYSPSPRLAAWLLHGGRRMVGTQWFLGASELPSPPPADSRYLDIRWLSGFSPCVSAPARLLAAGLGFLLWDPNAPRDCPQHHSLCSLSPPKGSSHPCWSRPWVSPGLNSLPPQTPSDFTLSSLCFPAAVWGWSLKGPSSSRTWTQSPRSSHTCLPCPGQPCGKTRTSQTLTPGSQVQWPLTHCFNSNGGHPGFNPSCGAPLCTQP